MVTLSQFPHISVHVCRFYISDQERPMDEVLVIGGLLDGKPQKTIYKVKIPDL